MENYIQVTIPLTTAGQQDILIAQLSECGYEGFEEEDRYLHAFITAKLFNEKELSAILSPQSLKYSLGTIVQQNWNKEWEKNFQPVMVDDFCAIRAGFHAPVNHVKYEIII